MFWKPTRNITLMGILFGRNNMELTLPPFLTKLILRLNPSTRFRIMCLGYNEDYEQYTELVWEDDKYLDFYDQESYPKFQLWFI